MDGWGGDSLLTLRDQRTRYFWPHVSLRLGTTLRKLRLPADVDNPKDSIEQCFFGRYVSLLLVSCTYSTAYIVAHVGINVLGLMVAREGGRFSLDLTK